MMEQDWKFTNFTSNDTSYYSPSVNPNDLYGVQELTALMLKPIYGHDLLPKCIIETFNLTDLEPFIHSIQDNWQDVLRQNSSLMAIVVFGLMVAILLPISGIMSCFVYCCCGDGEKKGPKVKKDSWCFCIEVFVYFLLLVLGWLGVALLILSDLAMKKGIDQLPERFDGYVNEYEESINFPHFL